MISSSHFFTMFHFSAIRRPFLHALRHIVRNYIPNRSSVWPCLVMVGPSRFFREVGPGICEFEMMKCQQKLHVTLWDGVSPRSAGCEC